MKDFIMPILLFFQIMRNKFKFVSFKFWRWLKEWFPMIILAVGIVALVVGVALFTYQTTDEEDDILEAVRQGDGHIEKIDTINLKGDTATVRYVLTIKTEL